MSSKPEAELTWRRATACEGGSCVEMAVSNDVVIIRSSANPDTKVTVSNDAWRKSPHKYKSQRL